MVLYCIAAITLAFVVFNKNSESSNLITLSIDGEETKTLSFESLSLLPGESKDFFIDFKSSLSNKYVVNLDFQKLEDNGLDEYVTVEVNTGNYECKSTLTNLFSKTEKISFNLDYSDSLNKQIQIKYLLPSNIGNEAQGKISNFNIVVGINK